MGNLIGGSWIGWLGTLFTSGGLVLGTSFWNTSIPTSHFSYHSYNHNPITKSDTWQELAPRKIEIDLSKQRLYAWEGENLVYSMRVSTGKRSTPTRIGKFLISSKYRSTRMRGPGYNIPNVPYAMYFFEGYAIHGAFWHNNFGNPVSHGCVNLPVKQARELYNWADIGTLVVVRK